MEAQMAVREVRDGEAKLYTLIEHKTTWIEVQYQCTNPKCKAIDKDRVRANDPAGAVPMINCLKCGNGRGLTLEQSMLNGKGMRLIPYH